ncbi:MULTISPECIES: glycosyltransferase family 2 protein [unclassified Tolypothrix]|uniref:glycosyltransferase family 2 protein n=1 Tax=unclassified Tolypothrix TaxID=2649714 RepID=UPI0005EAAE0D|nr:MULTISPECIES: glycosyltransferase family 2 protein [unclassified Tolypothrix]BAY88649.1 family 2 glycosyl transferase [Microchaete diplosiphon NIES-3275]EKF00459.1 putative family 2 glycosyltransferase [Tolypothrix sp. PCC 7601]MBE9085676.1 glycosyltransferase family 2 protein [Tolypothrix sp. LEGE 11397]UYD29321.1 glycosyltransferase family 2 protein [Tolypothrix sp. PCC 7712]UYD34771.1 glycosyltransferase family 2 protein [Tolypothrix sp. PCC 7601]
MKTSVSVVIPCYFCAHTIDRAVKSIVQQTLRPSEVILVNDGSKDDTWKILQKLQAEYEENWIKIVDLKLNYGPSKARNIGWDLATQDYIAFLDADNAWHPEKIAFQYLWMCNNPHVLVSGHAPPGSLSNSNKYNLEPILLNQDVKARVVTKKQILKSNPFETSSIMIKRNIHYRFDNKQRYCEDYFLWMQICLDQQIIYLLDKQLTYVYKQPKSLSSNIVKMRLGDINNFWKLWRNNRINLAEMIFLISKSLIKFMILLISPKLHSYMKYILYSHKN